MVKARFILKGGTKITIEGSTEEVGELLEDIERRERRMEERRDFMMRMREKREKDRENRNKFFHGEVSLTSILEELIRNGFFNEDREISGIMRRLERAGISAPSSTIHPLLSRLVAKGKLRREKTETGNWGYKKK